MKKDVYFVGSAKDDLSEMPIDVKRYFGYNLSKVQDGEFPPTAKVLKGFHGANVVELRENSRGDTYRVIYTVQFKDSVYVLHCFKKKSSSGISTPKPHIDLIKSRLKIAIEIEQSRRK